MAAGAEADELVRQYVHEALHSRASGGSSKCYDQMLGEVKRLRGALQGLPGAFCDPTACDQLVALLRALTRCVSLLHERRHELLLRDLLDMPLWVLPPQLRAALLDFLAHAVVAHGGLVQSALQTLVYSFLPPPGPPLPDPHPGEPWAAPEGQASIQDEVLAATEKVLALVPTAAPRVLPLIAGNMPHKMRDRATQCLYLRAVFRLAESKAGAPIREGLLAGTLEHLIGVDVEIRWEDVVESATEEAKEEEGGLLPEEEPDIFELEGMSELELAGVEEREERAAADQPCRGGWEGGSGLKATPAGVQEKQAVSEIADKLDSMMELTLGHLQRRVEAGQLGPAWDTLLGAFERVVLCTHRSKFTQFLVFYLCRQAPPACSRSLLHLLLGRLTDRQQPPITRAACAAYAASFLARAAYVPESLVVESVQRMVDWCLRYARDEDRRGGLPPIPSQGNVSMLSGDAHVRHAAFYAACQAVLYVLCYHMEPLLREKGHHHAHQQQANGDQRGGSRVAAAAAKGYPGEPALSGGSPDAAHSAGSLGSRDSGGGAANGAGGGREACADAVRRLFAEAMPRLLTHRLDPLGSCAKSVVREFGRQVQALGFPELAQLVQDWEAAGSTKHTRPLEMFFPFDPYLLRRSALLLDLPANYVAWRRGHPTGAPRLGLGPAGDSSSGSEDESDSEEEEEEEEEEEGSDMSEGEEEPSAALRDEQLGDSSSGLEDSSSSSGSSDSDSDSESDSEDDSESERDDGPKRTRFGSIPGSSLDSHRRRRKRQTLPGALRAAMMAQGAGSPTVGFTMPHGSYSTDGMPSPFGTSPFGTVMHPFGSGLAPMNLTK